MPRTAVFGLLLLLLVGTYFVVATTSMPPAGPPAPAAPVVGQWQSGGNQPAPDFTLPALDGGTLRLSDLRGKVVVLNFWATWCPPCREETPAFVALQREFADRGVVFVGVSKDEEGFDVVRPFAEQYGVNYPIVLDDGTVSPRFEGITGLPTTYLISPRGEIRYYMPGGLTQEQLRPVLVRLLEEHG